MLKCSEKYPLRMYSIKWGFSSLYVVSSHDILLSSIKKNPKNLKRLSLIISKIFKNLILSNCIIEDTKNRVIMFGESQCIHIVRVVSTEMNYYY